MQKRVLLFPGQGSQYTGMGKRLCQEFPAAEKTFKQACDILGFNLQKLCFEGPDEKLMLTENAQIAIFTTSIAAFRVYNEEIGLEPHYAAGHSLGEISALCSSGAIKFADALKMVHKRGGLMKEVSIQGGMAAVIGIEQQYIEEACQRISDDKQSVIIANHNLPDQYVISGNERLLEKISLNLIDKGAKVIKLNVNGPFHTPLMENASAEFEKELMKYEYYDMEWPVISNLTGKPYKCGQIINNLKEQIIYPVRWYQTMEYLRDNGVNTAVEIGPKNILSKLIKKSSLPFKTYFFSSNEEVRIIKDSLEQDNFSGNRISTAEKESSVPNLITRCMAAAVSTPNSNWDYEQYQEGVIKSYQEIKALKERLENSGKKAAIEEKKFVLEKLYLIFDTKRVSKKEQMERFKEIINDTCLRDFISNLEQRIKLSS